MPTAQNHFLLATLCALLLAGCEQLGIEGPAQEAAAREAEGRAIGSACRHSGRALEDCFTMNPKAVKAAVFTGWRDMDAYMRENNLEIVTPVVPRPDPLAKKKKKGEETDTAKHEEEGAKKEETAEGKAEPPAVAPSAPAKAGSKKT